MRHYEILTILPGTLAENEVQPVVDTIKSMIESEKISPVTVEAGGKSRLAYPIKHIRYGYFHVFTFEASTEIITKIEEKLRLFGQILRTVVRTFDPAKRESSKGSLFSLMNGNDEDRENGNHANPEEKEEAPMKKDIQTAQTEELLTVSSEKTEESEPKTKKKEAQKEVNIEEFDKQLEAILDDKIAGL